jgi:hypothetical protein
MKNLVLLLILLINLSIYSQKSDQKLKSISFTQKVIKKRGTQLILKKVLNDSRCPEGVNCIWAGECEIEIAIYKNRKLISTEIVMISPKLYKENIAWFSKFYPNIKITEISVLPYPKSGFEINPKDFFVKIMFE